jgi:outer membrane protein OmpA-like peptidoglycan-associated protein
MKKHIIISAIALGFLGQGCNSTRPVSNQDKGVAIGAGSGAVIGGVIGNRAGNTGLGAIIGATVGGVAGGIIGNRMDKQAKEIEKEVPGVKVDRVGEGIVVEFNQNVLFDVNKSELKPASYTALNNLTKVLNRYPDTNLEIDGHTDNTGTHEYNMQLSERRANAVATYLKSQSINGARIVTRGQGETYPEYSNDTEAGRAANRRVEFQITANEKMQHEAREEAARR